LDRKIFSEKKESQGLKNCWQKETKIGKYINNTSFGIQPYDYPHVYWAGASQTGKNIFR